MVYRFLFNSSFISSISSCRRKSLSSTLYCINSLNSRLIDPSSNSPDFPIYIIPKRWHLGHSHAHSDHRHHHPPSSREAEKIFRLGLAADIGLAAGKAFTGYLSGSTAIIADAAHSVSDVVLSGVALWSFKAGNAPRDKEHPYGHGKFESLGAFGISCMLLVTAGGITWHALDLLLGLLTSSPEVVNHSIAHANGHSHSHGGHHHAIDMDHPVLALSMTVLSIAVKEGLYWITKKAGERQGSGLMKANAWHHRADAISSVVALIGVGGSILGVKFLDPLAGLVVSGMILKAGLDSGYQSVLELVDAAIPQQELDLIKQTILKVESVKGCHRLRGRRAGSFLYLDVHIEVDPFCSVSAAHGIGENVRSEIHKSHPEIAEAFIHIDPAYLVSPSTRNPDDLEGNENQISDVTLDDKQIEEIVSNAFSLSVPEVDWSNAFSLSVPEKMKVEQIKRHILQGKIYLEIEVSMPEDTLIREAKKAAEAAENEIFKAASGISLVSIQLRLSQPWNKFDYKSTNN